MPVPPHPDSGPGHGPHPGLLPLPAPAAVPRASAAAPSPALPDSYALPRRPVPSFPPIRAGRGRGRIRLWTAPHRGRRAVAAGLAMTAAVLAAGVPHRQLPWW